MTTDRRVTAEDNDDDDDELVVVVLEATEERRLERSPWSHLAEPATASVEPTDGERLSRDAGHRSYSSSTPAAD